GALLGLLAVVPAWFRMRREISRLRRDLRVAEKSLAAAERGLVPETSDPDPYGQAMLPPGP
ncbi:MAG: LapA family protein, partial [Quisquiliibacterium sp.]